MTQRTNRNTTLNGLGSMSMKRHASRIEGRIAWLLDRMTERERRRQVAELLEVLVADPRTPGARELAIVERRGFVAGPRFDHVEEGR